MLSLDDLCSLVRKRAPAIAIEPRPAATFRVGAIGHRELDASTLAATETTVSRVLAGIREQVLDALAKPPMRDEVAGESDLVLLSPLAEGADRLLAHSALRQGYRLGAILPFSMPAYEATFDIGDKEKAIAEFRDLVGKAVLPAGFGVVILDGKPDGPDAAFLDGAQSIARSSDVLVAILSADRWGSLTGVAVREAIDSGVPTIAIDPGSPKNPTVWIDEEPCPAGDIGAQLALLVRSLLQRSSKEGASIAGLDRYCNETVAVAADLGACESSPYRARTVAPVWIAWCMGLNRIVERAAHFILRIQGPAPPREGLAELGRLDFSDATVIPFVDLYLRYCRADALANEYAELHRSAQTAIAILGAATIVFASIPVPAWRPFLAGAELACLCLALLFVFMARRQAWLDRWLSYRLLAETCRYAKFLLLTGSPSPFAAAGSAADLGDERMWVRDHVRWLLRAHALSIPGRNRQCSADSVDRIKTYILECCLARQAQYHGSTAAAKRAVADALRTLALLASAVTVLAVLVKFLLSLKIGVLLPLQDPPVQQALTIAAIVLPALTGAVLALRAFGEHEIVAKRSGAMVPNLAAERRRIEKSASLRAIGEGMSRVAHLLLREVDGWIDIFADKQLE